MRMIKSEAFIAWVQRWKFIIILLLGVLFGWIFSAIETITPAEYTNYVTGLIIFIIIVLIFVFWSADIFYKYREIEISKRFFSLFTLQKLEYKMTILKKDGSAKMQATRVITTEGGEYLPYINFDFWSESCGEGIKHICTKVNGKEVSFKSGDITHETRTEDEPKAEDGYIYKSLKLKVPILNKVGPSIDIICDLEYPPGAFKNAFDGKEDTFSVRITNPTRLLQLNLKLNQNLVDGKYMFAQPSFEVHNWYGDDVGRIEEMIRKEKEYPEFKPTNISWNITNPIVGLIYILKFEIVAPKTPSSQKRLSNNYTTTNN